MDGLTLDLFNNEFAFPWTEPEKMDVGGENVIHVGSISLTKNVGSISLTKNQKFSFFFALVIKKIVQKNDLKGQILHLPQGGIAHFRVGSNCLIFDTLGRPCIFFYDGPCIPLT